MKVRTLRKHINSHGPTPTKNVGRQYEVREVEGANLIADGLVEKVAPPVMRNAAAGAGREDQA